ncbi:MAG: LA_2272 family surface repeat-containing protein [Bacteroidota bacterium]
MKTVLFLLSALIWSPLWAQQKMSTRIFQVSLTPGLSTNGIHPGGFSNYFSINFTSGYSSANYLLEIASISNLNENGTRGLQVGGLANLTGANAFKSMSLKEVDKKKREGFEANLSGAQFSGLGNIVINNVFGWQTSGGVNIAGGALQGFQLAGVANIVVKYSFAVQVAGAYNVSLESMDGVQVAGLFNFTAGGLYGAQISLFNKAGYMEGKNSYENNDPTAFQLGIINKSGKMNGFQVGLINIGKRMQGTQIGLINVYRGGKDPGTRDGTSVGLLNIGSTGYVAMYANESFIYNFEIATGTIKNKRIVAESKEKQIQNALICSFQGKGGYWALGYGLKKFFFNRSGLVGMTKFNFFASGIDLLHINHENKKLTKELSLLSRPNVSFGSRLHRKNKSIYFFLSVAYNLYRSSSGKTIDGSVTQKLLLHEGSRLQQWVGVSGGILIQ